MHFYIAAVSKGHRYCPSKTTPNRQVIFFKSLANSKVEGLGVMSVAISSPKKKRNEVNQSIEY